MTKKIILPQHWARIDFVEDVNHIVSMCANNGYSIHPETASIIWAELSDQKHMTWEKLPTDDVLLRRILGYAEVVDNGTN